LRQWFVFLDEPKIHIPNAIFCISKGGREQGLGG